MQELASAVLTDRGILEEVALRIPARELKYYMKDSSRGLERRHVSGHENVEDYMERESYHFIKSNIMDPLIKLHA